ncbi:hypothetical protein [Umezawaea sp. Da 62-37]|uniref:hypothetical protein n=1 Tax=Umezawaea sp. Da 62-37 TaxID=3075927 RepID=UPI0028F6CD19|nr:hypothetical protein [Umezawaea sp. Da 62-37]WNV82026.1 hypothetical protein RM788_27840 [Umezawaea sp. Da 62-37]
MAENELVLKRRKRIVRLAAAAAVLGLAVGVVVLRPTGPTAEGPPAAVPSVPSTPSPAPPTAIPDVRPRHEEPQPPESGSLRVDLTPSQYVQIDQDGSWWDHAMPFEAFVSVTSWAESTTTVPLRVSVAFDRAELAVHGTDGPRWVCEPSDAGLTCTSSDVVEPKEAWPPLAVEFSPMGEVRRGTIAVTASGPGDGAAEAIITVATYT